METATGASAVRRISPSRPSKPTAVAARIRRCGASMLAWLPATFCTAAVRSADRSESPRGLDLERHEQRVGGGVGAGERSAQRRENGRDRGKEAAKGLGAPRKEPAPHHSRPPPLPPERTSGQPPPSAATARRSSAPPRRPGPTEAEQHRRERPRQRAAEARGHRRRDRASRESREAPRYRSPPRVARAETRRGATARTGTPASRCRLRARKTAVAARPPTAPASSGTRYRLVRSVPAPATSPSAHRLRAVPPDARPPAREERRLPRRRRERGEGSGGRSRRRAARSPSPRGWPR